MKPTQKITSNKIFTLSSFREKKFATYNTPVGGLKISARANGAIYLFCVDDVPTLTKRTCFHFL